jgi:hypothetical protein
VCCSAKELNISQEHQSCVSPKFVTAIIHAFKCHNRKQLIQNTVAMIEEGLLQDAMQMKLDL